MNVDMNKVKAQMQEHWDMDAATFDAHTVNKVFQTANDVESGWKEIDFKDVDGNVRFYIEVNGDNEVWHFDWVH
jgi:hypothetical protein